MTVAPLDPFALVGTLLDGQYRVDAVVAEGGFGVVYKGWHLSFDQPIAIKALKIPEAVDASLQNSVLAKFREEAQLQYTLSQASLTIARSIGFGAVDTPSGVWAPYMVLEWLEGKSLATDLVERRERGLRGRALDDMLDLIEPAALALAYAHSRRVAHRDVKPGNLFLATTADHPGAITLKLLDFGIAKKLREGVTAGSIATHATAFSSFTPFYAAPEQFDPRMGVTGPWTDVYSLALVLGEVLTDRQVIDDGDAMALIARATDLQRRPTPRSIGADIPDAVEAVFVRALAVYPKDRFAEMGPMWEALRGAAPPRSPSKAPVHTAPMASVPRPLHETVPMASVARLSQTAPFPHGPVPHARQPLATPAPVSPQRMTPLPYSPQGFTPPPYPAPPGAYGAPMATNPQGGKGSSILLGCLLGGAVTVILIGLAVLKLVDCLAK